MIAPLRTPTLRLANLPPDAVLGCGSVGFLYQSRYNHPISAFPCVYLCGLTLLHSLIAYSDQVQSARALGDPYIFSCT